MCPVIRISDNLYSKLENLAEGFDTPANVIEKLLEQHKEINIKGGNKPKKITEKMYKATYIYGKKISTGEISQKNAVKELISNFNWENENSAKMYLDAFKKMMRGNEYKKTINSGATEYYLKEIRSDYGDSQLKTALLSVGLHINYYREQGKGELNGIQSIYKKFSKKA